MQPDGLSKRGFKLGSGTGLGQEPVISGAKLAPEPRPKCLDFPGPSQGAIGLGLVLEGMIVEKQSSKLFRLRLGKREPRQFLGELV